jgi:beta-lactamase regulating signal transducer with metallopeptidase domain/protocatechuate 3,4-dioxygenase beta subunit
MFHYLWVGTMLAALAAAGRRLLARVHPDVRYGYALACLTVLSAAPSGIVWVISSAPAATPQLPLTALPTHASVQPATLPSRNSAALIPIADPRANRLPAARWLNLVVVALPAVWLAGAPLTLAYLLAGLLGAERVRRQSQPVTDQDLSSLCQRLAIELGIGRRIAIGICDRVTGPLLLGIVRPLILLPSSALTGWSPAHLEMALLHELAHVRRWDNLVNLIQRIIETALFFHPAVWLVSGWVRREREYCCDQVVVAHTGRALDYAQALFALSGSASSPFAHASFMSRNYLVHRIRSILNPEEPAMRLTRSTIVLAVALLFLPVALVATYAQKPAQATGKSTSSNRELRKSGVSKQMKRTPSPNAPPWQPGVIPATIPIVVEGVAKDEAGRGVSGATISLHPIANQGTKTLGTTKTDADGHYRITAATVPVMSSFAGQPFRKEITPYAGFILSGLAPGQAIAWSEQKSVYALKEPNPADIQGRLPLGDPVELDITFHKPSALTGKVVDERGQPVEGAKLRVSDCDLLDDAGLETNNRQGFDWDVLPGSAGRAVTGRDGAFRIDALADRACFSVTIYRPETDNTTLGFFAATIPGPDTVHEQLPPAAFNGRMRHEVKTSPITLVFPRIRPISVTVAGDDTGKPLAGVRVFTLGDSQTTRINTGGTTDAAGKVLLGLPPGQYKGICSDPPIETRYIRTYQRPLIVEPGQGVQPYELRQTAGVELIFKAEEARPGHPVAGAFFWKYPEDSPDQVQTIRASTVRSADEWTNDDGEMRAVLHPEPGKRYRFRFAGIHQPNMPAHNINPDAADKQGYEAFPTQSTPVELIGGTTLRLRFVLHKAD